MALLHNLHALLIVLTCALANAQSTKTVSVISTTSVHATASDTDPCNNFYGACVVYGNDGAPHTTTVYRDTTIAPSEVTTSTTVVQTTIVTDAGACANFAGSCVVYGGGNGQNAYTTVVAGYQSGQQQALGNSDGYIAQYKGHGPAVVGAGSSLAAMGWTTLSFVAVVAIALWL